jgi:predicted esterase
MNTLALPGNRQAFLLAPSGYSASRSWPLVLGLHGATQRHDEPLGVLGSSAESRGFLLLVLDSADVSWDAIRGDFGPDLSAIDHALAESFDRARVDASRVILEGFSDGASYALALGCGNGDLFGRIVAFSPGFVPETTTPVHGHPRIFISHGRQDPILPIDMASRRIVPELRQAGYDVTFQEFDGGHTPRFTAAAAVDWMLKE